MADPKTAAVNLSTAIESWLPKGPGLWYSRGPWSSSVGNAVPAAVPEDIAFSKLRVEAPNTGRAVLRWKKSGTVQVDVGVYRSTDGTIFTLVSDLISSAVLTYTGLDLEPATRYWYKLSQDSGLSFSQTVSVVSYASRNRGVSKKVRLLRPHESLNVSPGIALPPVAITSPLEEQSDVTTRDLDDKATPCTVCSENGALVLDCGECNTFRVLMTEEINSITVVGCDPCPTVQLIAPPGSSYGICGWPPGCRQAGDECFEAPLEGGPIGRFREDGVTFNGYPGSPSGGLDDGPCPCVTVFPFNIQCCDADLDCTVDCTAGASASLKACGGIGPYRWAVTGSGTIDGQHTARTEGPHVKVKVAAATPGVITGGDIRFLIEGVETSPGVITARIYHVGHGYCSGIDKYPSLLYAPQFIRLKTTAVSGSPNLLFCVAMASETTPTPGLATILTAGNAGNEIHVEVHRPPPDGSSTCVGAPAFEFNFTIAVGVSAVIDTGIRVALISSQECTLPCAEPILVQVADALGRTAVTTLFGG